MRIKFTPPAVVLLALLVASALAGCASAHKSHAGSSHDHAGSSDSAALTPDAPELPDGFDHITGSGVAWTWYHESDRSAYCRGASNCSVLYVQATEGCDSLYVEANTLDASGTVVGYTNGTTSALQPGDEAKIALIVTDPTATKVKLTKIDCS